MLKIACIGAGYFATFHIEAWTRLDKVSLVAICDADLAKAQALADQYGVKKVYSDYKEMIEKEKPEVVDVITPPETHLDICSYLADRGISLICQKPLAPTFVESQLLVEKVSEAGIRFMVHENFRFQPWFRKIKELLKEGKLGDQLHTINFRFRTGDGWQEDAYMNRQPYFRQMPKLFVYETGVHYLDTFRYLGGEISSVFARLRKWNPNIAGEDTAMIHLEFENGAMGLIDANRYNESDSDNPRYTFGTCLVEGSKGAVYLASDGILRYKQLGSPEEVLDYSPSTENFAGDCVFATQQHFVEAFLAEKAFETEGTDYLKTLQLQEAVYTSADKGELIVL